MTKPNSPTAPAPAVAPAPAKKTTHPYRVHQPSSRLNSERIIPFGSRMGIRG